MAMMVMVVRKKLATIWESLIGNLVKLLSSVTTSKLIPIIHFVTQLPAPPPKAPSHKYPACRCLWMVAPKLVPV